MTNETLGKWHFWLFLIGFHLTFDFMHIPGVLGMPRRIYTYEPGRGWEIWNLIVSIGVIFQTRRRFVLGVESLSGRISRVSRGQRSLGCMDAGVGDTFSAARIQLCQDSRGA